MRALSQRVKHLKQSGIRAASVRCAQIKGINLGQGVCDLPIPQEIKTSAYKAIDHDLNLYSPCEGILPLRQKLAQKIKLFNDFDVNPEEEILITHGSTGAFVSAVTTLFDPLDEVILFEPFYGYHKHILELQGISVRTVSISLQDLSIKIEDIQKAITQKTKGIVICTPNNPTGKVFSTEELLAIGNLAEHHGLWILTDEIYEYITYPGFQHVSCAKLKNFRNRTITISGFSKTYNMTGWRLGYTSGPKEVISKMALVQDLYYVCPATPLQHAVLTALDLPKEYYQSMCQEYLKKRNEVVHRLQSFGFQVTVPQGAYYLLASIQGLGFQNDLDAVEQLLLEAKVAVVSGRSFYTQAANGNQIIRVCYALQESKIMQALSSLTDYFQAKKTER